MQIIPKNQQLFYFLAPLVPLQDQTGTLKWLVRNL